MIDDLLTHAQRLASVQAEVNADRARFMTGATNSTDWELGHDLADTKADFRAALDAYIDERVHLALSAFYANLPTGGNP